MSNNEYNTELAISLKSVRDAAVQLAASLKSARDGGRAALRRVSYCANGMCYGPADRPPSAAIGATGAAADRWGGGSGARDGVAAGGATSGAFALGPIVASAIRAGMSGDIRQALQSTLQTTLRSLVSGIAQSVARGAGGGLGGSLLGSLVGGGLGLLAGKLFQRREKVQVDNVVRAEVLNFPRLTSLDFAANPASRLFGARAMARGPAFAVEVNYRNGAEDVVVAKVAQKLLDINSLHGMQ
jgi:hypothetical protein